MSASEGDAARDEVSLSSSCSASSLWTSPSCSSAISSAQAQQPSASLNETTSASSTFTLVVSSLLLTSALLLFSMRKNRSLISFERVCMCISMCISSGFIALLSSTASSLLCSHAHRIMLSLARIGHSYISLQRVRSRTLGYHTKALLASIAISSISAAAAAFDGSAIPHRDPVQVCAGQTWTGHVWAFVMEYLHPAITCLAIIEILRRIRQRRSFDREPPPTAEDLKEHNMVAIPSLITSMIWSIITSIGLASDTNSLLFMSLEICGVPVLQQLGIVEADVVLATPAAVKGLDDEGDFACSSISGCPANPLAATAAMPPKRTSLGPHHSPSASIHNNQGTFRRERHRRTRSTAHDLPMVTLDHSNFVAPPSQQPPRHLRLGSLSGDIEQQQE